MVDIGELLFRDILKMTEYPGHPFTGNVIHDLVMFFFIPTVFIILFVFILLGTMFPRGWGLRMLTGIAIYLFIVFGGWYATFARLAGPYFIILIVILGGLAFLRAHIGVRVEEAVVRERAEQTELRRMTNRELTAALEKIRGELKRWEQVQRPPGEAIAQLYHRASLIEEEMHRRKMKIPFRLPEVRVG